MMILKLPVLHKVIVLFLLLSPQLIYSQTAGEYIEKGRYHFNIKERFDSSIYFATLALKLDSNNSFAYYLRAFSKVRQELIHEAIPDIQKAIGLNPNRPDYLDLRGFIYDYTGKYQLALHDFDKAISIDTLFARVYYHRGTTYHSLNNNKRALEDLNFSIELDSTSDMVYFKRGVVFLDLKIFQKALKDFSKCILLNKNYADAYYNRGIIYDQQQNFDKALIEYNKAYKLKPDDIETIHNRAVILMNYKKEYAKALDLFTREIKIDSTAEYAFECRALVYCHLKKYKEALADIEVEIRRNPQTALYYRSKGYILTEKGDYKGALIAYSKSISIEPIAEAYYQRGRNYNFIGDLKLAKKDFLKAIELDKTYIHIVPL